MDQQKDVTFTSPGRLRIGFQHNIPKRYHRDKNWLLVLFLLKDMVLFNSNHRTERVIEVSKFSENPDKVELAYRDNTSLKPFIHSHSFYEIYYFHHGICNYLIGDKIYLLSPGDLILMNGMTLHCPKIDPSSEYIRTIFHYHPACLRPYLEPSYSVNVLKPFQELCNHRISFRGPEREETERMLAIMNSLYIRGDQIGYNRFLLNFADFLYYVYEHCQKSLKDNTEPKTEKEKNVQRIISFLNENYADDIHLEVLQERMHLNKFYISKIFKEMTGVTVFEFLYQLRINQAKIQFLFDPGLSVTEACYQVGFKYLAHFSRIFKEQVGITPEQYKKTVNTANGRKTLNLQSPNNRLF